MDSVLYQEEDRIFEPGYCRPEHVISGVLPMASSQEPGQQA
jgi:hypothetical protein